KAKNESSKSRLLKLSNGRWQEVNLPDDWNSKSKAQLIASSSDSSFPLILRQIAPGDNSSLMLYKYKNHSVWESQKISLPGNGAVIAMFVNKQLVIAQQVKESKKTKGDTGVSVNIYVIRSNKRTKTGKLSL